MYRLSGGKTNIMSCIVIMAVILGVAICGMRQDTTASTSYVDNKTMSVTDLAKVSATDGDSYRWGDRRYPIRKECR